MTLDREDPRITPRRGHIRTSFPFPLPFPFPFAIFHLGEHTSNRDDPCIVLTLRSFFTSLPSSDSLLHAFVSDPFELLTLATRASTRGVERTGNEPARASILRGTWISDSQLPSLLQQPSRRTAGTGIQPKPIQCIPIPVPIRIWRMI